MSQVLDSLEEMQCLTDCTGEEKDLIEKVFQDTKLHALLLVRRKSHCWYCESTLVAEDFISDHLQVVIWLAATNYHKPGYVKNFKLKQKDI